MGPDPLGIERLAKAVVWGAGTLDQVENPLSAASIAPLGDIAIPGLCGGPSVGTCLLLGGWALLIAKASRTLNPRGAPALNWR